MLEPVQSIESLLRVRPQLALVGRLPVGVDATIDTVLEEGGAERARQQWCAAAEPSARTRPGRTPEAPTDQTIERRCRGVRRFCSLRALLCFRSARRMVLARTTAEDTCIEFPISKRIITCEQQHSHASFEVREWWQLRMNRWIG